jgi:hypothetical protein
MEDGWITIRHESFTGEEEIRHSSARQQLFALPEDNFHMGPRLC